MSSDRFRGLRPSPKPFKREVEDESVKHLQELYTVAVGLALTVGVERLLPAEGRGEVQLRVGLVFAALVMTLVPFYHGAQRHLDINYLHFTELADPERDGRRKSVMFFGDFLFLFIEGILMIAMGASVESAHRFLLLWLVLVGLDVLWLAVFVNASPAVAHEAAPPPTIQRYGWAVVNVPALVLGSILLVAIGTADQGKQAATLVSILAVLRSVGDYSWNWHFYFPNRAGPNSPAGPGAPKLG